jgi:hypothetical protein
MTVLLLASSTTAFPTAAERRVTVAVDDAGPITVLGFNVTEATALETTRNRLVVTVVPASDADTATPVVCVTEAVLAMNVALV